MRAHVRKYVPAGTFGFLTGPEGEIFFHLWVFNTLGGPPPIVGEEVEVEVHPDASGGGLPRAHTVSRVHPPVPRLGAVTKFDPNRGYGFVTDTTGSVFYLHKSDIAGPVSPAPGTPVRFYVGTQATDGHRPRACHVTLTR